MMGMMMQQTAPLVTIIKPRRGPFHARPRNMLVSPALLAHAAQTYQRRVQARPAADRATHALMTWAQVLDVTANSLRVASDTRSEQELRQQGMAFARTISEFVGPELTHWTRIGRAFQCAHNNAIYAHRVYGAAMHAELERILSHG